MKIKVCHFVNIITGRADGVYAHLRMIFQYCDREKFQNILVFQGNADIIKELNNLGIQVHVVKTLTKKIPFKVFYEFYSFVKNNEIDIIHCHLLKPYIIAGLTNIFLKKKMIFNYHGLFINAENYHAWEKMLYGAAHKTINLFKSVNLAIVPSYKSRNLLLKETKLFPKIIVYYNGYDPSNQIAINQDILNFIIEAKEFHSLVGVVGRLEFEKRIDLALNILSGLKKIRKDVYFLFLGDGSLENEMREKIKANNLGENCKILGFLPNAKAYMSYFDLLLIPSDREGMPLSLWEAMANGVPVVSTDVGGIREIIKKENCGLLFPKGNVEEGIQILNSLLNNYEKRRMMSKNAVEAIEKRYNNKIFGLFINNLYENLLKNELTNQGFDGKS